MLLVPLWSLLWSDGPDVFWSMSTFVDCLTRDVTLTALLVCFWVCWWSGQNWSWSSSKKGKVHMDASSVHHLMGNVESVGAQLTIVGKSCESWKLVFVLFHSCEWWVVDEWLLQVFFIVQCKSDCMWFDDAWLSEHASLHQWRQRAPQSMLLAPNCSTGFFQRQVATRQPMWSQGTMKHDGIDTIECV